MNASLLIVALSLSAAPTKIALMPLSPGEGVTESMATSITGALTAELRKLNLAQIVTAQELSAVLGVERQKELLGCSTESCLAELAGALDVDEVILGNLSRVGQSWLLQVNRVNAKTGATVATASRRKKGGTIDDVLDDLPSVSKELFATSAAQTQAPMVVPASASAPVASATAAPLPPPLRDVPFPDDLSKQKTIVTTDGKGHYVVAVDPFQGFDTKYFAGDAKALYAQRVFGGSREGETAFDVVFWEPRAKVPAEASFGLKNGRYTLTCGGQQVPFQKLSDAAAKKLLARAKFYDVRWQRRAYALARDDEGNYFYVDQARTPEDNQDFHLYVGPTGALSGSAAEVLAHDGSGDVFRAGGGKLKLTRAGEAEWIAGPGRTKLNWLPVEDHARFIYSQLGVYRGQPLGTPCDGHF
ncbi:MAG: hypothetical protein IRZ16_08690 [Myxococcaceae bacterium]|nr:hypothetical protein [Myxococcaceae bacterium]